MFGFFNKNNKFKKRSLVKKREGAFIPFISTIAIFAVFIIGFIVFSSISNSTFKDDGKIEREKLENKEILSPQEKERLKKLIEDRKRKKEKFEQDLNKVNIMVVGRGGIGNDAPYLTDSIILLSLNKKKNHISMMSIPRDLYVEYGDTRKDGRIIKGKINGLYPHYLQKYRIEEKLKGEKLIEKALKKLEEKVTQITDEKIDFYVDLDFKGFVRLINSIGGVTVNVPRSLYDEKYPAANHEFQIFSISKGIHNLNGTRALMYVRTRKNTGGDFGRSQRQQQVVGAIKEKILNLGYLTSPTKIKKLYKIFDNYIGTNIGIIDAVKIFTDIKLQKNTKIYSSGLNASCIRRDECKKGGFLFYPNRSYFGGQSVLLAEGTNYKILSNYNIIHSFSNIIFNFPKLFVEKQKISIFSKLDDIKNARNLKYDLIKYGLNLKTYEIVGKIREPKNNFNEVSDNENKIKKLTLVEYNELNKKKSRDNSGIISTGENISSEYYNKEIKIIINNIDKNSETVKFLRKYLKISDKNIVENIGGPKYAKDKKTKIEIIYIKSN